LVLRRSTTEACAMNARTGAERGFAKRFFSVCAASSPRRTWSGAMLVREGEAVSQTEEFVLLTTEAKWYRNDRMTGKPVPELDAALGDEFLVDFVRVYDVVVPDEEDPCIDQ